MDHNHNINIAFKGLRKRIKENEIMFLCFFLLSLWLLLDNNYFHLSANSISSIGTYAWPSSAVGCFFGFLNYRIKRDFHDVLVATYQDCPPPPKSTLIEKIEKNAKFFPVKIK